MTLSLIKNMRSLKAAAYLFDLNGTIIDDMAYHHKAWFHILNDELGASLSWEEVKQEMYGKNQELLIRVFGNERFSAQEMQEISIQKEIRYQKEFLPELKLLPGLTTFLQQSAAAGIKMAIGSAAIPFNIDFVLDNLNIRNYFPVIISAEDVRHSKPDPETFTMAAQKLNVNPEDCIVFEDAPKGVEAAERAGMQAVVLTTTHQENEFAQYKNILCFCTGYDGLKAELMPSNG